MHTNWQSVLERLSLSTRLFSDLVTEACEIIHRRRANEEFCDAVLNELTVILIRRLKAAPDADIFHSYGDFKKYVYTLVRRINSCDTREITWKRIVQVYSYDPADLREPEALPGPVFENVELAGLIRDRRTIIERCLGTAADPVRETFIAWCRLYETLDRGPTYDELGREMSFSPEKTGRMCRAYRASLCESCADTFAGFCKEES